jgi:quinol monooxygenase YgiN
MPIRHVVVWTLHDSADIPRFQALLEDCRQLVPGILEFDIGVRQAGFEANADVVLVSTFADAEALAAYQQHPQHQAVGRAVAGMRKERRVIDYPVDAPARA